MKQLLWILGCALVFLAWRAEAAVTAKCAWIAPTAYADGTALAATDIDHYTIVWSPAAGATGPTGMLTVPASQLSATVPIACGTPTFTITVTTGPKALHPNMTSASTTWLPFATNVTCEAPLAPSGFTVTQ